MENVSEKNENNKITAWPLKCMLLARLIAGIEYNQADRKYGVKVIQYASLA
jgi:hypothetical protein